MVGDQFILYLVSSFVLWKKAKEKGGKWCSLSSI